ncbi:hypothetical protein LWM68_08835 [Niabella sp. W65]|nr:hypothetical protein [Niabella sp. W65]MCH7362868.1 hypothetical protein [Niabella sp. W65]
MLQEAPIKLTVDAVVFGYAKSDGISLYWFNVNTNPLKANGRCPAASS